jgi:CDP-paratose 2-epimerase
MKILVTGACGFAGAALIEALLQRREGLTIFGIDNLMRTGSETNRSKLRAMGVKTFHGDVRCPSDIDALPAADWVIDAAANPSVLAGVGGGGSSLQLIEHNLFGVVHVLEYAKRHRSGLILLSTSRVYSIRDLCELPLRDTGDCFELDDSKPLPPGISDQGIGPEFSTQPPISLYGGTKLAAEVLALEYSEAFNLPVWIDRCGVLAGAGQFGTPDQGIFAFWVNAHARRRPLKYIGFDGMGKQARDAMHPRDLAALLLTQMESGRQDGRRIYTAGGGPRNTMSLRQLNAWCDTRFGAHTPAADLQPRRYDIPWVAMDSSRAAEDFQWAPETSIEQILSEIAAHSETHPDWLQVSGL